MALRDNIKYWETSLKYPEELIENYYVVDNIILYRQDLIKKIHRMREIIAAYCCLIKDKDDLSKREVCEKLLLELSTILESTDNIHYSEFIAFWKVFDFSYSVYMGLKNKSKKLNVLRKLIENFCERREKLYAERGYSDVTVQVLYDTGASRAKGVKGVQKLEKILTEFVAKKKILIKEINSHTFFDRPFWYFKADEMPKLFENLRSVLGLKYAFGKAHQNKPPDLVIKLGEHFIITEAKHLKETGGAQSKQVVELIEFIKQSEKSSQTHYTSFLDGIYFNLFITPSNNTIKQQKKDIEEALRSSKQNYFINTTGFIELINDILKNYET